MVPVAPDARLAELAWLDVLDVRPDGSLALNAAFHEECIAAYDADPDCLGTVFQARLLARAAERGMGLVDVDELALAALEIAAAEEDAPEPR